MAATAWAIYNKAKNKIAEGTIPLNGSIWRTQLHTSASNASVATFSLVASITNEVANGNGYVTGGKTLPTPTWTTGASAGQYAFDSGDPIWTASGGTIPNIKFAVIRNSTGAGVGHALCWSKLTTAQFTLAQDNTLTIQMNANGIFTLT